MEEDERRGPRQTCKEVCLLDDPVICVEIVCEIVIGDIDVDKSGPLEAIPVGFPNSSGTTVLFRRLEQPTTSRREND